MLGMIEANTLYKLTLEPFCRCCDLEISFFADHNRVS